MTTMKSINVLIIYTYINLVTASDAPKLIIYKNYYLQSEGTKFRVLCSIQRGSTPLSFQWLKNREQLTNSRYKIETNDDLSILTIDKITKSDSTNYTCVVSNTYGTDSQTVVLDVKVPPTWLKEPQDIRVKSGDDVVVECIADGLPKPTVKWISSKGKVIPGEVLNLANFKVGSSEAYECIADNGIGDSLKKSINVFFSVPAKFDEKYSVQQVKRGESARLKCNATGDHPVTIKWTKDNAKLEKIGSHNFEIIESITDYGLVSELLLRITQRTDGAIYKCEAENTHGKDERTIKLVVLEIPGPPKTVHVKEVWSRTASIVWSAPYSGNSPISKYTIQYWRHQSAPHRLNEFTVSSTQTSALIKDLSPGLSYEMTVVGENEVGRGEAADTVKFTTGEEEPSAPPNDISVEGKGPTTIRITWRAPPKEHWNGVIKGYYVGYRKARETNHPFTLKLVESKPNQKSAESESYEYFLRDLVKGNEYAIVVKAYNSAGSGPQSHEMFAHTFDGDLPPAQLLSAMESTNTLITVRWHQKDIRESQTPTQSFTLHYQREGESKWKEVPISSLVTPAPITEGSALASYNYNLENLESGIQYRLFVTAVNRYGFSDPSNVVIARTDGGDIKVLESEIFNQFFNDGPYYLQPSFTIPLLSAVVIIIIVIISAFVCVRRINRERAAAEGFIMDSATLHKQLAGQMGTTPRYMDFDKPSGKPLMMTEAGNAYPTPYATIPMGGLDGCQFQTHPSMMKNSHIYDHPQLYPVMAQ
ncbi:cell adhesion molecule DSCAML1-like isoform X1 [Oppia nitens]|uniref:cell adhesion molecule DSCAML1-like isoform X1 n=1 Tax=Oppia nitens TaxID=1686743 RepID=UPI0023DB8AF3|nr:cell adhesion molecule DSCAML1-like isoform X1 [Oppia nitens]